MTSVKIKVFKIGQTKPDTVVTIPLKAVRIVTKLVPQKVTAALEREGIDLSEIANLAEKQDIVGNLVEVERETERIVIAIE